MVVATCNEVKNIHEFLEHLNRASAERDYEMVVDDGSSDGTAEVTSRLYGSYPVGVLVREGRQVLSSGVVGARLAAGEVIVVMDADLQHPLERAEFHRSLAEKFLREAEDLLARGDYLQVSEKAWGAAAQIVKAVAAKAGKELRSHGDLWRFVSEIAGEDRELRRLWRTTNSLHQNF